MITVRNLTKHFGGFVAVEDLSFDVAAGEVIGFLGPNGAGKTTTLRILTGYIPASSGTARIDGMDVLDDSLKVRSRIGYLPENVPLYLEMRVDEYLKYRGRLKGLRQRDLPAAVDRVVEQCGLEEMQRRIVGQLSKGFRQRVGLADALVSRPPILLLDEPTSGLDPHQRKEVLELIRRLATEHTVILSSHILAEVESIATRLLIIQKGRLLAEGRLDELAGRLQESPTIRAEVRRRTGNGASVESMIEQLVRSAAGVDGVCIEVVALEEGWVAVRIPSRACGDLRVILDRAFHQEGFEVRELARQTLTLEEVFLRITAEAAQGGAS